jgi:hypothetical protein
MEINLLSLMINRPSKTIGSFIAWTQIWYAQVDYISKPTSNFRTSNPVTMGARSAFSRVTYITPYFTLLVAIN